MALRNRSEAVAIAKRLVDEGFVEHVSEPQAFQDAYLFFRFTVSWKNEQTLFFLCTN
jgi:hypothetical protein